MALRDHSNQREMFGLSPDLQLPAGHWARALDGIIETLGLERLNRKYEHTPGEPAYDVRVLVKILIYAYGRGITSSREMARQCEENIAFQFLTRGHCPDFRTISLFRRKKRHLLRWVFRQTVVLRRRMGMARLGLVALDSAYYTDDAVLEAAKSKTDCFVPDSETAAELNNPTRGASEKAAYHVNRFEYDKAKDEFTCPQGRALKFWKTHNRRGQTKVYRCGDCETCPVRASCTDHASGFRTIQVRPDHAEVRKIRDKFKTDAAKAVYRRRKIIEGIFGRWQHNWGIRRLRLRCLNGFSAELHLLAIAHNLAKLLKAQQAVASAAAEA